MKAFASKTDREALVSIGFRCLDVASNDGRLSPTYRMAAAARDAIIARIQASRPEFFYSPDEISERCLAMDVRRNAEKVKRDREAKEMAGFMADMA